MQERSFVLKLIFKKIYFGYYHTHYPSLVVYSKIFF
jgi:hypothetical protein